MPFIVPTSVAESKPVPAGNYRAKVISITDQGQQPNPYKPGTTRWRALILWGIELPDGTTVLEQRDYQTVSFFKKANLPRIARALGVQLTGSDAVDLEQWAGRACNVAVEQYIGQDGQTRSKISDYWPMSAGGRNVQGAAGSNR